MIVEDDGIRFVPRRQLIANLRGALRESNVNTLEELLDDRRRAAARGE